MAWNEPGGGGKDPWGSGNGRNAPPDLDAVIKSFTDKLGKIFGGGNSGGNNGGGDNDGKGVGTGLVIGIFVVAIVVWAVLGVYQVDAKEKVVVLRFGVFNSIVGDGLHWNPPLMDIVTKVGVTEERQYKTGGQMLTKDENIVELPMTVHYNVKNVKDFVLNVSNPEISLHQSTDSALRHVVGSTVLDDVLSTGREQLSVDVRARLQSYLDNYGTGIHIVKVNILEAKPPAAVKAAYDDVIKAREDQERLINEAQAYSNGVVPEARGGAQRVLEEADAYKAQVVAEAEGNTQRFLKVLAEYQKAPQVTRERMYLDAIEGVFENTSKIMVDVEGGNNMLYLPLDKIMQQSPAASGRGKALSSDEVSIIADRVIDKLRSSQQSSSLRRESR